MLGQSFYNSLFHILHSKENSSSGSVEISSRDLGHSQIDLVNVKAYF